MRAKNQQLIDGFVSREFYRLCGNDGVLRPEAFSSEADPSDFHYLFADRMTYALSSNGLTILGELEISIRQGDPFWLLLHLMGNDGEMACWIKIEQTDRKK